MYTVHPSAIRFCFFHFVQGPDFVVNIYDDVV